MKMENKVLVKLYIPLIEKQYDVWIPKNKKIASVVNLLAKGINELTGGNYQPEKMPILYDRITGQPYSIYASIKKCNITNGTKIIMI